MPDPELVFIASDVVRIKGRGAAFITKVLRDYPNTDAMREDLLGRPCKIIMDNSHIRGYIGGFETDLRLGEWRKGNSFAILIGPEP